MGKQNKHSLISLFLCAWPVHNVWSDSAIEVKMLRVDFVLPAVFSRFCSLHMEMKCRRAIYFLTSFSSSSSHLDHHLLCIAHSLFSVRSFGLECVCTVEVDVFISDGINWMANGERIFLPHKSHSLFTCMDSNGDTEPTRNCFHQTVNRYERRRVESCTDRKKSHSNNTEWAWKPYSTA